MDFWSVKARLDDLKTAEVAALRRGDAEAAKRVRRHIQFVMKLMLILNSLLIGYRCFLRLP